GVALAEGLDTVGEQLLKVCFHAVLDQTGVHPQFVRGVVQDLLHRDDELLARLVDDGPDPLLRSGPLLQRAGGRHPVQGLVGPVVGVDGDAAVRLDQDQAGRRGEVGGEPPGVVHGATGNDETHGRQRYSTGPPRCDSPGNRSRIQGPHRARGTHLARPESPGNHGFVDGRLPAHRLFRIRLFAWCGPDRLLTVVNGRSRDVYAACPISRTPLSVRQPLLDGGARGEPMSLDVSPALLEQAERGEVDEAAFVDCVRTSLPYAWEMISSLVAQLKVDGGVFADNQTPPPDEQARGQLLRALASDAIRGALQ